MQSQFLSTLLHACPLPCLTFACSCWCICTLSTLLVQVQTLYCIDLETVMLRQDVHCASAAGEYSKVPEVTVQHPPRLFCLSDAVTGGKGVATEEILHFAQSDLSTGDVMLLDTFAEVCSGLWCGFGLVHQVMCPLLELELQGHITRVVQLRQAASAQLDQPLLLYDSE